MPEKTKYPRLFISEAIEHHQKKNKLDKPIQRIDLARDVIDHDIDIQTKKQKISNWDAGRTVCQHFYIIKLAEKLDCTAGQILGIEKFK